MDSQPRKPAYKPEELPPGSPVPFQHLEKPGWVPMVSHGCTFAPQHFETVMMNLVRNPNLNSKWLFRADILYDDHESAEGVQDKESGLPQTWSIQGFACRRTMVRNLIPRNTMRDAPLAQTCFFYKSEEDQQSNRVTTLVIYRPHATTAAELPFYHPKVEAIAQLHEWDAAANEGTISIHFLPFPQEEGGEEVDQVKLGRIAYHLLELVHKHGHTTAAGYTKRVNHDVVVPQDKFQDRYSELKNKYARGLVDNWAETTDPAKHVFEDLGIAAFLIELWAEMYRDSPFPGFVDIGCGNGLLVYVLQQEGYAGWGFDARERKSWAQYKTTPESLQRLLLLPSVVPREVTCEGASPVGDEDIHSGIFPKGTFIISNHADELTPWTPILATISDCPFIMIPCCSHNLAGNKYRAPPPRDRTKGQSAFASLVDWVTRIAEDCGWRVETEMLRIPSTRNTGLLGRNRTKAAGEVDIPSVMSKYGGAAGYYSNVAQLLKSAPRSH